MFNFASNQKMEIMSTLSVADFRSQLAKYFDLALTGEKIFIRRKNKLFTIIPVEETEVDIAITPKLAEKIEKAKKELRDGNIVSLKSHEDVDLYFESM